MVIHSSVAMVDFRITFRRVLHAFCAVQLHDFFFLDRRPSTFAQAAKLRRLAVAKEKELAKCKVIFQLDNIHFV